ncbi:phosphoglycerate mutase-like protein [Hypoxylon sp. FL1284]|nr:phosphoglycerate mutase-like protein [Hypoxylon sp. FL1284]
MASTSLKALAAAVSLASAVTAQSVNETVWSSFAYVLYGERTPDRGIIAPSLTPLGAQQLYSQGSLFRARYLSNSSLSDQDNAITTQSPIAEIEQRALDNSQITVSSSTDSYVAGGALAFLQGLYPPVTNEFASNNGGANASTLANGSSIEFPLGGYQYPNVHTISSSDPDSVWLEGHSMCTEYGTSGNDFRNSELARTIYDPMFDFYQQTWREVFPNTLPSSMLNFDYAYDLYDYAQYAYDHDQSVRDALTADRLQVLRDLANIQQFELNGDLTASGLQQGDMIRAISGRTLAAKVVAQLSAHISSAGTEHKMTLMFGSFEPFLAFFALSDLAIASAFRTIPQPGSAMVFELFSTNSDDSSFPRQNELWTRFLFRNGTDSDAPMTEYPLFSRGNSESRMRWSDFVDQMGKFSMRELSEWCDTCSSLTSYCSAFSHDSGSSSSSSSGGRDANNIASLSPAVAGVIGAVTTIAVLGLAGTTAFVFGGLRIRRKNPTENARRHSSLGGFRGAEKMEPDRDVSVAKNGVRHERVGSWELGTHTVPPPIATESNTGATFGASIRRRDEDDDKDSIAGLAPVRPAEQV